MQSDSLTISVLFGSGVQHPEIQEVVNGLPRLALLDETCDPERYCRQLNGGIRPDVVLVEMDGQNTVPPWLERLPHEMPQTAVLLCSHTLEPEFLIRIMQVGIREFLPLPLAPDVLEAAIGRVWQTKRRQGSEDRPLGQVIVVTGHKGGAGTTMVAVNLAVAMAELSPEPLALVDLGRPFPDVANFLDLEPSYTILDLCHNLHELDQSFIQRAMQPFGDNLFVLHGCPDFREQENIEIESLGKIFSVLRHLYRYTIVDLSHWLDEFFLQVLVEADLVLMLTGLTVPDLRNLKRLWPMLLEGQRERRKIKLVINRFDRGSGLVLRDVEQVVKQEAFATLSSDYLLIMEALNRGAPIGIRGPRSKLWRELKALAQKVKLEMPAELDQDAVGAVAEPKRKFWLF
ncbi:MAG: CpaE family protein [Desulfobaccales bacterium]